MSKPGGLRYTGSSTSIGIRALQIALERILSSQGDDGPYQPLSVGFGRRIWTVLRRIRTRPPRPSRPVSPPTSPANSSPPPRVGLPLAVGLGAGAISEFGKFVWNTKWWILGGLTVYAAWPYLRQVFRREGHDPARENIDTETSNADANMLLRICFEDILKSFKFPDLDVQTGLSVYSPRDSTEVPALCLYCIEHFHLEVRNQPGQGSTMGSNLESALNRVRRAIVVGDVMSRSNEESVTLADNLFYLLSRNSQFIGLFVVENLGAMSDWSCCSGNLDDAIVVRRPIRQMSYMAAQRMPHEFQSIGYNTDIRFAHLCDGPEYIVLSSNHLCHLVQNLGIMEFIYQGFRAGMDPRSLTDTLFDLCDGSCGNILMIFVQFKNQSPTANMSHPSNRQHGLSASNKGKSPEDGGEGPSCRFGVDH